MVEQVVDYIFKGEFMDEKVVNYLFMGNICALALP